MKEVIKISRSFKSTNNVNVFNEKKFNNFMNSFEMVIANNNKLLRRDELMCLINSKAKKSVIKELSVELGINKNELIKTLCQNMK